MIRFIYGSNGSGKTTEILRSLLEDTKNGIHCFLIVPDQEALQLERTVLASFPASCQLNIEILGFSRLYNRVCREYGGLSYSYITKPIRSLLMWKTIHDLSSLFKGFSNTRPDISMADMMLSAINEFKANGISPAALEIAQRKLPEDSVLAMRLSDIALIYACFDGAVAEKYSDSADDLSNLRDMLKEHDFFAGSHVYIDSFSSFTAVQHQIIERIFRTADEVTVTVPIASPSESGISADSVKKSLKKLKDAIPNHTNAEEIFLGESKRASSPCLAYLSQNLWTFGANSENAPEFDGSVVCEICDTPYTEADAVCAHIRRLLQDGVRCRDIAIVARDAEKYRGIMDVALMRSDIPYFFSQKTDLCSMPAVKFILSALKIKQYNWQRRDVIAHLKTGLCDFDAREINLFEEYVSTWNIGGSKFTSDTPWTMNPDGFTEEMSDRARDILNCANSVKERLVAPLEEYFIRLEQADTVEDMCRATYSYISKANLEAKLQEAALNAANRNDAKKVNELSRIYSIILKALADIAQALEGESVDTDEFIQILRTVFEKTEIGSIPTSIDEVIFGSAPILRTNNPKYTFVIGLCEGEFPATVSDSGLLSTTDRNELARLGVEFSDDNDTRSSDELMFVQRAFASPSQKLFLSYHKRDLSGNPHFPSIAFSRIKKLFPDATEHLYDPSDLDYLIPSPRSAVSLFRVINEGAKKESLRIALGEHIPQFNSLSSIPVVAEKCTVSTELLPKSTQSFSPSSFEKYVNCPFDYFCSNVLKLRETKSSSFNANDIGSFVHYILQHLIKYAIPTDVNQPILSDEEIIQKTNETVEAYIRSICPQEMLASKRLAHLYSRLRTLSLLIIRNTVKEFSASEFRPIFFEFNIQENVSPLIFSLDDGSALYFRGTIDRVDVYKKGDDVYIRIVDYKTGTKVFNIEDVEHGVNLQMLIYIFSICRSRSNEFKRAIGIENGKNPLPAGVIYFSTPPSFVEAENYESQETIIKKSEEALCRSGLFLNNEDVLHAMNSSLDTNFIPKGKSTYLTTLEEFDALYVKIQETVTKIASELQKGKADAAPLKYNADACKYCKSKPICRNAKK